MELDIELQEDIRMEVRQLDVAAFWTLHTVRQIGLSVLAPLHRMTVWTERTIYMDRY